MGLLRKSHQLQDFTTIGTVGSASQQMAGHRPTLTDPNTSGELALYYFGDAGGAITTDETSSYTLTNNGTVAQAAGLFGGSTGAASFNGSSQYFTAGTLLGTTPSAIAIDFWFKATDGQPAAYNMLFTKVNDETGGSLDIINLYIQTSGKLLLTTYANSVNYDTPSVTTLPNGQTDWYYCCVNWDSTNGARLWLNGVLEGVSSAATALMNSGSTRDFCIGARNFGGSISNYFSGSMAYFRVRNKVLTQVDVDVAYATKYTWPTSTDLPISTSMLVPYAQEGGVSSLVSQLNWGGMEVARSATEIYRYGGLFGATDKLKLSIRE